MSTLSDQQSHVVKSVISRVLERHGIADGVDEEVMAALNEIRLISYQDKDVLPLLSVAGRALVMVMDYPDMTMREMSVRMGTVESNISRSVTALVRNGLVSRTRIGRNNHYKTNLSAVLAHPDMWRLLQAVDARFADEIAPNDG